ncbi:MAG: hypothetical protein ABJB05_02650 [Parafilimonas sp.]
MANPYEYIIFEPDQVLTNDNLNETFNYLDQQNRWTRNKLIGIGIVCGFEIISSPGTIEITKGCGVTSQGYLILQDDKVCKYYLPYVVPAQPTDLLFDYPGTDLPFYQPSYSGKNIFQLITADEQKALDPDQQIDALPLSTATFLSDYVVVLFLEATEIDLKNCDMFDCNNNGEKIAFNVRMLLVAKKDLPGVTTVFNNGTTTTTNTLTNLPHEIYFKRFNVPYTNLQTANDVINAFAKLVDDFTLTRVANAYIVAYEKYKLVLNETGNPFTGLLKQLQTQRDSILKSNSVFIQYFYDFIDDLIKAYYEFTVKVSGIISACCADENLFPLHLVLGEAPVSTNSYSTNAYRQYFIYSPLFNKGYGETSEAVFLFKKMTLLTKEFTILSQQTFANALIKVTPSQYEHLWLSQRAIPYYYQVNDSGNELYKSWSYYKTSHGNAAYNLGYNAYLYNSNDAVINPLLYDIEYYNFFRIEGHIGKNYTDVLNDLVSKIQNYNLPFDVVAVQAGGDETTVSDDEPQCSFQDLNSMFNVLRSDIYCLLGKLMCYAANQTYDPPIILTHIPFNFENINAANANEAKVVSNENTANATVAASAFEAASNFTLANNLLVNNAFFSNFFVYQKSTFLKQQSCYPTLADNSAGKFYAQHVPSGTYFFSSFDATNLSNNFLTIVDLIEEVISSLYFASLSLVNIDNFSTKFTDLQNYLLQLNNVFLQFESDQKLQNFFTDFEEKMDLFDEIIDSCFIDQLSSLKNEYNERVKLIKQQMLFPNYYNSHRGLEHKAGVPKGGTFVIVYNVPAPKRTTNTISSNANANIAAANNLSKTFVQSSLTTEELTQRLQVSFSDVIAKDPGFINRAISILAPSFTAIASTPVIPDYAVIADFYLPYLCCSDCAPINYILTTPKDDVVFDLQPTKFLFNDAHNYPFTTNANVTPADFDATTNPGNLNLVIDNNKLSLHPAMDIKSTLTTTLTYKTVTIQQIIIVVPDASFTVNITTDVTGAILVALAAKHTDATTYEWIVNDKDGVFESKPNPTPVPFSTLQKVFDSNEFRIEFIITYVINDVTSGDEKKTLLTSDLIKKNLNKGPFEPIYTDAFNQLATGSQITSASIDTVSTKAEIVTKKTIAKSNVTAKKATAVQPAIRSTKIESQRPEVSTKESAVKKDSVVPKKVIPKKRNKKP